MDLGRMDLRELALITFVDGDAVKLFFSIAP